MSSASPCFSHSSIQSKSNFRASLNTFLLRVVRANLDFQHVEIFFCGKAVRTLPGIRDIFPACARRYSVFRQTEFLFIDKPADDAHISPVFHQIQPLVDTVIPEPHTHRRARLVTPGSTDSDNQSLSFFCSNPYNFSISCCISLQRCRFC